MSGTWYDPNGDAARPRRRTAGDDSWVGTR